MVRERQDKAEGERLVADEAEEFVQQVLMMDMMD